MAEYIAKKVIFKNRDNEYLIPYIDNIYTKEEIDELLKDVPSGGGAGAYTGQIIPSFDPLFEDGLHLLDGGIVYGNGIYAEFVNTYIANLYAKNPERFITEEQWQEHVNTYGVCGRYVYDTVANTVRLPKVGDYLYSTSIENNAPVVGNGMTLGYTNGTKVGGAYITDIGTHLTTSNAYGTEVGTALTSSSNDLGVKTTLGITTDPTKSGIIADLSDITQPLEGYYYIVLATETKTKLEVDLDNIAVDLNNKVDKQNMSVVSVCIEEYVNGTSGYRIYSDIGNGKYCEQWGIVTTSGDNYIAFLKKYKDENFIVSFQRRYIGEGTKKSDTGTANRNTIAGSTQYGVINGEGMYITVQSENGCTGVVWHTKGYLA